MRVTTSSIAILAALLLATLCGTAQGPAPPSFDSVAGVHRGIPGSMDPCGPHRPIAGICRMLRPVRG
ncbi:MAG: hypothetical protein ABWX83_08740 [Luteibacter sp.]